MDIKKKTLTNAQTALNDIIDYCECLKEAAETIRGDSTKPYKYKYQAIKTNMPSVRVLENRISKAVHEFNAYANILRDIEGGNHD